MPSIRKADLADFELIWPTFQAVVQSGDTYPNPPDISYDDAKQVWVGTPQQKTYVVCEQDNIIATFYIRPNQPGLGSHVANAGIMVSPNYRGQGIGKLMGQFILDELKQLGYKALQFNLVVSTNNHSIAIAQKIIGAEIIGILPKAFHHQTLGYVDAYVMYRWLDN